MKNFNSQWDKLTDEQKEAVKNKTQEAVNNGYDPNKIKTHIENNFSNTPNNTNQTSTSPSVSSTTPSMPNNSVKPKFDTTNSNT